MIKRRLFPSTLVLICGPVGSGKTTVLTELRRRHASWRVVESYTTRAPRRQESAVKPYRFVTVEQFMALVKTGDIFEYEQHVGHWYGTSTKSLNEALEKAPVVLMDLQLKGVATLKERYPDALDIYLHVGLREARRRLTADWRRAGTPRREILARLTALVRQNRRARRFTVVIESLPNDIKGTVDAVETVIEAACAARR